MDGRVWSFRGALGAAVAAATVGLILTAPIHALAIGLPLCCRVDTGCASDDHCPLRSAHRAPPAADAPADSCHGASPSSPVAKRSDTADGEPVVAPGGAHVGAPSPCSVNAGTEARPPAARTPAAPHPQSAVTPPPAAARVAPTPLDLRAPSLLTVQSWRGPPLSA